MVSRVKATCLALLETVRRNGRVEPVAEIVPLANRPWIGSATASGRIVGDIVAPIAPEAEWERPSGLKVLLDTHIGLWGSLEPRRLGGMWLSSVSVWETLLLAERGRVDVGATPQDWVQLQLVRVPPRDAPVTAGPGSAPACRHKGALTAP